MGDEISIKVNCEIDCVILDEVLFQVVNEIIGESVLGIFGCDFIENKLVFLFLFFVSLQEMLIFYDNQLLIIKVVGLWDEFGNFFLLLRNEVGVLLEIMDENGNVEFLRDIFKWDF